MGGNEDENPAGRTPHRRGRLEIFYFEQAGSRTYLRFTNLALFLVLFLTFGAMAMIIALYVWNSNHVPEETNVNIRVTTQEPTNYNSTRTLIQPPPPPPPLPRVTQGPMPSAQLPLTTPTPAVNGNSIPTHSTSPTPTPSPSPVRTPT